MLSRLDGHDLWLNSLLLNVLLPSMCSIFRSDLWQSEEQSVLMMQVNQQQLCTCRSTSIANSSRGGVTSCNITCGCSRQTAHLTARETTPEEAAHIWQQNFKQKRIQP
jgi:hypothetical protein